MALTLRDEFGDLVKWKVILIVVLVLLVIFVGAVFPGLISELAKGGTYDYKDVKAKTGVVHPEVYEKPTEPSFSGTIMEASKECGQDSYCTVIMDDQNGVKFLLEYPRAFGKLRSGYRAQGSGDFLGGLEIKADWVYPIVSYDYIDEADRQ
ncbi:MAG: hypothetical protein JXB14_03665 [Candidatus Altiarchaeota archaeon]|nr:hypothetical protein [Candidatus Altiarchaeota archaeon]